MRRLRPLIFTLLTLIAGVWLAGRLVTAQGDLTACSDTVTQALASVESLCAAQPRNSACYGNVLVNALFLDDTGPSFFEDEGDIINLGLVRALQTSPYGDPEADAWGMSVLSLQASLPGALPGQNALFLLMGGAQIESAVTPDIALRSVRSVPAAVPFTAPLRANPDFAAEVVLQVEPGQLLLADAQSGDGRWIRVTAGDTYGWAERDALLPDPAQAMLPVVQAGAVYTPMQAFYLRTGIGAPKCATAPSALVVQGPQAFTVAINANGAQIVFDGTMVLDTVSTDEAKVQGLARQSGPPISDLLRVTVLEGEAVVEDEAGNPTTIRAGEQSTICLAVPENLGEDGQPNDQPITDACGGWTAPQPIGQAFRDQFALLDGFPLNHPIGVFAPPPTSTPLPTFTPAATQTRPPAVISPARTATPAPPTAVPPTGVPATQPPPTAVPPTSDPGAPSATPAPSSTPMPSDTPADTPLPTPTDTPLPTPTDTLLPTPTDTLDVSVADIDVSHLNTAPPVIGVGQEVCFHLKLDNYGPGVAEGVSVSDLLPPNLTYSRSNPAVGSYDSGSDSWTLGMVDVGQEPQIWVCGTADTGTEGMTLSTTAILYATNDSSPLNNAAFLSVDVLLP